MDYSEGVADLHLHTTASDGTCGVDDRVEQAREVGLDAIAITDHDTIADEFDARVAHNGPVELITGVEVRADVLDTKVELLAYYVDPTADRVRDALDTVRTNRHGRNRKIVSRLEAVSDLDRSYEEIRTAVDGILGRPHIAKVLVEEGIVDSVGAAFETYLGTEGAAFVPMERVPAAEIIETMQSAGGVVSLAHPGRIRTDRIETLMGSLVADGLDAIEVPYPYDEAPSEGYADVDADDAADLAEDYELLLTGGSDCHGPGSGKFRIGDVRVTQTYLDALRERAVDRQPL